MLLELFDVHLRLAIRAFRDILQTIDHMQIKFAAIDLFLTTNRHKKKSAYQLSQGTVGFSAPLVMNVLSGAGCWGGLIFTLGSLSWLLRDRFSWRRP